MIFRMKLADQVIEIRSLYENVYKMCSDYMIPDWGIPENSCRQATGDDPVDGIQTDAENGRKPGLSDPSVITVSIQREDISEEMKKDPSEKIGYTPQYLETLIVYKKIISAMAMKDTFMMHGSVICTNGFGYMITAASGTGKTTRTKLWIDNIPGSCVVNGDKPLIRICNERVYVYGSPWCGKEGWNTNVGVILRAVFLLERADDNEPDSVTEISFYNAFPRILQQTFRPNDPEIKRKTLHLLKSMEGKVRFYLFRSSPTVESVCLAYETARPMEQEIDR